MHERVRLFHSEHQHGCCRVALKPPPPARGCERIPRLWARIRRRQLGEPYECGQWCGHPGDCTWWTPGGYLPPRLITVLDWFDAGWRGHVPGRSFSCPICRTRVDTVYGHPGLTIYGDAENAERDEVRWEFQPCGCEGRELAGDETTPGS